MPIRVMLADDEPLARRRLVRFLRAEPDVEVAAECANGAQAVAALRDQALDLVFLDVQMPDMSGLEVVAAHGADRMPAVIFVTAYDAYAVRAFEVHALDYVLKPVTVERFRAAFQRAREHLERVSSAHAGRRLKSLLAQVLASEQALAVGGAVGPPPASKYADRLTVRTEGRVVFLRASEVDWFEADGNYVRIHVGKNTHLIRETITALDASLDPALFARIHRSTIVNLDRIRELQPWFAGDYVVVLKDGTQLKLTRTYREHLQLRLHVIV